VASTAGICRPHEPLVGPLRRPRHRADVGTSSTLRRRQEQLSDRSPTITARHGDRPGYRAIIGMRYRTAVRDRAQITGHGLADEPCLAAVTASATKRTRRTAHRTPCRTCPGQSHLSQTVHLGERCTGSHQCHCRCQRFASQGKVVIDSTSTKRQAMAATPAAANCLSAASSLANRQVRALSYASTISQCQGDHLHHCTALRPSPSTTADCRIGCCPYPTTRPANEPARCC
jgi:hypothetical protein